MKAVFVPFLFFLPFFFDELAFPVMSLVPLSLFAVALLFAAFFVVLAVAEFLFHFGKSAISRHKPFVVMFVENS